MALPKTKSWFSPDEYLAMERKAAAKHEYLDGLIYAMAGASPTHNQICFNLAGELHPQLKGTTCVGYTSDQKIRTDPMDLFSYPDLTIVCGAPQFHDNQKDVILNPTVIIEVLSPKTEEYDRNEKFIRYQNLKSLTDYILISQSRPAVEHFVRQKGKRQWLYTLESDLRTELVIASVGCKLHLADIYDRVVFPPSQPPYAIFEKEPRPAKKRRSK
ncbi:MAG: Uma2 family endonuclease [Blastocatellia bacterium]|nr:Uma2 family endonuclease [Blastocatellia bacterium]